MRKSIKRSLAGLTLFAVLFGFTGLELTAQDNDHEIKVKLPESDQH